MTDDILHCSFCKKSQQAVTKLIAGPSVFICDECVDVCIDILASERTDSSETSEESILRALKKKVIGQDEACRQLATVFYGHSERSGYRRQDVDRPNLLITGPTGSGKTHSVKCLARELDLPFAGIDVTRMSGNAYFREQRIFDILLTAAKGDRKRAERGIVLLDHFDTLAAPGPTNSTGKKIQESLLGILEGASASAKYQGKHQELDTSKMLFIGCGEFGDLQRAGNRALPSLDHLVSFGLIRRLAARFAWVVSFQPLSRGDLFKILKRENNRMLREYKRLFLQGGVQLSFSDRALEAIATEAARQRGGVRGLHSILENIALDLSFELSSNEGEKGTFEVDADFVLRSTNAP